MNVHELPMILFTVLTQMSVGAFIALGVLQTLGGRRYPGRLLDRLADPVLLAIGPTLIAGLLVSMLHMNDIFNAINVIRHVNSSWLSREILAGVAFASLGFAFAAMQLMKWGTPTLRRILAVVAAVAGLVLVFAQSMVYYSLETVPAWHSWATFVRFFGTTVLLGSLAVGVALAFTLTRAERAGPAATDPDDEGGMPSASGSAGSAPGRRAALATLTRPLALSESETGQVRSLVFTSLQVNAASSVAVALVLLIGLPVYLMQLGGNPAAQTSAQVFVGTFFVLRLVLLALGAIVIAFVVFRAAAQRAAPTQALTGLALLALGLCFVSEIMGRSLFYDSMARVGM